MPLFHFLGLDKPGALQLRIDTRPAHLAHVKDFVRLGGPLLDDNGQPIGSAMIVEAESLEAARAKLAEDPYAQAGLFATTALRPWRISIGTLPGYDG